MCWIIPDTVWSRVEAVWNHELGKELRVIGSVDGGGWRAFNPLCDSFIMREDGSFVGE